MELKKFLSLLLAACLLLSAVGMQASATEPTNNDLELSGNALSVADIQDSIAKSNALCKEKTQELLQRIKSEDTVNAQSAEPEFYYTVSGNEATITGLKRGYFNKEVLFVPEVIDGYKVTAIGDSAFVDEQGMAFIYLPDTLKTIGNAAFKSSSVEMVCVNVNLREIGAYAFENSKLCYIYTTPISLSEIIEQLQEYGYNGYNPALWLEILSEASLTVFPPSLTTLGKGCFKKSTIEMALMGATKVERIPNESFYGCNNLVHVSVKAKDIGKNAFSYCGDLSIFQLELLESVSKDAFRDTAVQMVYPGARSQLKKILKYSAFDERDSGFLCLGFEMKYKDSGKLDLREYKEQFGEDAASVLQFTSRNSEILRIERDGQTYTATGAGTVSLQCNLFEAFKDEMKDEDLYIFICGDSSSVYATVSYTFWQQLIRIFLFGWLWY